MQNIKKILTSYEYQVFLLLYHGNTYSEIGKILGKDYKQIDNTIQRMKVKIRKLLTKEQLKI